MNQKLKYGGPAFPFEYHNQTHSVQKGFFSDNSIQPDGAEQYCGITVRDYFATKALPALIAKAGKTAQPQDIAYEAYTMADAMLKAREGIDDAA